MRDGVEGMVKKNAEAEVGEGEVEVGREERSKEGWF